MDEQAAREGERIDLWRLAGLDGVEVLHAHGSTRAVRVFNEAFTFGVMLHGLCDWRYRRRDHSHASGQTLLNEPGEPYPAHRHDAPGAWQVLFIHPERFLREAAELGAPSAPHFAAAEVNDPAAFRALRAFHGSLSREATALERESRLAACIARVPAHAERRLPGGPARDRPSVRLAREYLHAHLAGNVTLDALARASHTSKYHLLRVFQAEVGMSPHTYQMQLRLALALRLLRASVPPSRAALDAGFTHQTHLGRAPQARPGRDPRRVF